MADEIDEIKSLLLPDPLRPFGFLDVLPYYCFSAHFTQGFAGDRELASRIWIPEGPRLVKRAARLGKLTASNMAGLFSADFFRKRKGHLKDAGIEGPEKLAWQYFPPRKLADLFYATNHEGAGKPVDRIFFDIDRGKGMDAEQARRVAELLLERLKSEQFSEELGKARTFQLWTGHSFHVYAFLDSSIDHDRYDSLFGPDGRFSSWADDISREVGIKVVWGHEKGSDRIVIDPSQTPSGKLDRMPFSLHMKDGRTVDGVSVPLDEKSLHEQGITDYLASLELAGIVENIEKLAEPLKNT